MGINLLTATEINIDRLSRETKNTLHSKAVTIDLVWQARHGGFSGKLMYQPTIKKRFLAPPVQFYNVIGSHNKLALVTEGFGTIITSPSDAMLRYSSKMFHATLVDDANALLADDEVRKRLNITYLFHAGDLMYDKVVIGDNKKVRTYFEALELDGEPSESLSEFAKLGKLVCIHRKSKNAAPSSEAVGLLTATGILYRLDVDVNNNVVGYAAIGCIDL